MFSKGNFSGKYKKYTEYIKNYKDKVGQNSKAIQLRVLKSKQGVVICGLNESLSQSKEKVGKYRMKGLLDKCKLLQNNVKTFVPPGVSALSAIAWKPNINRDQFPDKYKAALIQMQEKINKYELNDKWKILKKKIQIFVPTLVMGVRTYYVVEFLKNKIFSTTDKELNINKEDKSQALGDFNDNNKAVDVNGADQGNEFINPDLTNSSSNVIEPNILKGGTPEAFGSDYVVMEKNLDIAESTSSFFMNDSIYGVGNEHVSNVGDNFQDKNKDGKIIDADQEEMFINSDFTNGSSNLLESNIIREGIPEATATTKENLEAVLDATVELTKNLKDYIL